MVQKDVEKYYNEYYLRHHQEYFTDELAKREVEFMLQLLGKRAVSVCDVGFGDGRHLRAFAQLGAVGGFGFDLSEKLVRIAQKRLSDYPDMRIEKLSFVDWKPEKGAYNITYCWFSGLAYCDSLSDARELTKKMLFATKTDGLVVIDVDNIFRLEKYLESDHNNAREELHWNREKKLLFARETFNGDVLETTSKYFSKEDFEDTGQTLGIRSDNVAFYGNIKGEKYSESSQRLITVMKKRKHGN